jgi:CheY-like chemotaxis protein
MARQCVPDLVLLDFNLPDIDGHEVLECLKSDPRCSSIPVIMVSADATSRQKERLLAAGAVEYLTKPLDIKKFLTVIDVTLAEHVREKDQHLSIPS